MKIIATEVDCIISGIASMDLGNCGYDNESILNELRTMIDRHSCFVVATSGTKGIIAMKEPIQLSKSTIDEIKQDSDYSVSQFSQLFESKVVEYVQDQQTKDWVNNSIVETLYPKMLGSNRHKKQVMLDIGFSVMMEDKRLFFLSDAKLAARDIAHMLTTHLRNQGSPEGTAVNATVDDSDYDDNNDFPDVDEDLDYVDDVRETLEENFISPFTENVIQRDPIQLEEDALVEEDQATFFNDRCYDITGNRQFARCLPYWLDQDNSPSPPRTSSTHSMTFVNYWDNLSKKLMRTTPSQYKYNFGQRFGNTHTGQPAIHVVPKGTHGFHNREIMLPPPGPSGVQSYLSGEKNNCFPLRLGLKPKAIAGFGAITELLLQDKLFFAGERKDLEKKWMTSYAIIKDQCEFELHTYEQTKAQKGATGNSSMVFRIEIMCTTGPDSRLSFVPFPDGILQSLHIESVQRYQAWRKKMFKPLYLSLSTLNSLMEESNTNTTGDLPKYLHASQIAINRLVGIAGLLEQTLDILTPPQEQVQKLFVSTAKIKKFLSARHGIVLDEDERKLLGIKRGCTDDCVDRFRRTNHDEINVLQEYSVPQRFQRYRDMVSNRAQREEARSIRMKYKLKAPESTRKYQWKKGNNSTIKFMHSNDSLYSILQAEKVSDLLNSLLVKVDNPPTGHKCPRWELMTDYEVYDFFNTFLLMVRESYYYGYALLYKQLLKHQGERSLIDPLSHDAMEDLSDFNHFSFQASFHGLLLEPGKSTGIGILNHPKQGLSSVWSMHNKSKRIRDSPFLHSGK